MSQHSIQTIDELLSHYVWDLRKQNPRFAGEVANAAGKAVSAIKQSVANLERMIEKQAQRIEKLEDAAVSQRTAVDETPGKPESVGA